MTDTIVSREVDDGLTSINADVSTSQYLRQMWERREFAVEVPLEELRTQHKTTLIGNVWHLGNPILTIGVYYFVFGTLLGGGRPDNFLPWLTVGLFAFRFTQKCFTAGAKALPSNSGLIKAIRFPRALLPVSAVVSNLMSFAIELGILAVVVEIYALTDSSGSVLGLSKRWLLLPLVVLVHSAFTLGAAFIAARLNDAYRDIEQLIPFIFQLLRYLSGVMIPIATLANRDGVPALAKTILRLNPLAQMINLYRWIFLGETIIIADVVQTTVLSFALLWFGFRFFRAAEWRYGLS